MPKVMTTSELRVLEELTGLQYTRYGEPRQSKRYLADTLSMGLDLYWYAGKYRRIGDELYEERQRLGRSTQHSAAAQRILDRVNATNSRDID